MAKLHVATMLTIMLLALVNTGYAGNWSAPQDTTFGPMLKCLNRTFWESQGNYSGEDLHTKQCNNTPEINTIFVPNEGNNLPQWLDLVIQFSTLKESYPPLSLIESKEQLERFSVQLKLYLHTEDSEADHKAEENLGDKTNYLKIFQALMTHGNFTVNQTILEGLTESDVRQTIKEESVLEQLHALEGDILNILRHKLFQYDRVQDKIGFLFLYIRFRINQHLLSFGAQQCFLSESKTMISLFSNAVSRNKAWHDEQAASANKHLDALVQQKSQSMEVVIGQEETEFQVVLDDSTEEQGVAFEMVTTATPEQSAKPKTDDPFKAVQDALDKTMEHLRKFGTPNWCSDKQACLTNLDHKVILLLQFLCIKKTPLSVTVRSIG